MAKGEEIVWQSLKSDLKTDEGIVLWIDVVTNFRVFQYDYKKHSGNFILFPSLGDVRITNEARGVGSGVYNSSSPLLTGMQLSGVAGIMGDISFYYKGLPVVTYTQVIDPETLLRVVKTLNKRSRYTRIEEGDLEPTTLGQTKIETADINTNNHQSNPQCSKCSNKDNPAGSKFCNKCGSPLSNSCTRCGNPYPMGVLFCGQCGSKVDIPEYRIGQPNSTVAHQSNQEIRLEDNFIEYSSPEHGFRINYPVTWKVTDGNFTDAYTKVIFSSLKEDPTDTFLDSFGIGIQDPFPHNLQTFIEININDLRTAGTNFNLEDSFPTTLANMPAHQMVYTREGRKNLSVCSSKRFEGFFINYQAEPAKYFKFLSTAEQMISSFEFI